METAKRHEVDASWNGSFGPYPRELGLAALFARQVQQRPDGLAIDAGAERVTYAELDERARQMARWLRDNGVGQETPVGVHMGPRVEQIVAQVAICQVGATYVPLDPSYPQDRLALMIDDASIDVVITDAANASVLPGPSKHLCVDRDRQLTHRTPHFVPEVAGGPDSRSHILYTSGSTGRPKGIEILARNVSRLVMDTDYVQFVADDRIAQISNFSFDAAIFEVWGALLNGATLVLIPKTLALDPHAFKAELSQRRVSMMFMTTSLFNLVAQSCPEAFAGVRYVVTGGERANPDAMRAVLRASAPDRLINAYGPTEGTTFSSVCDVTLEILAGSSVPIGKPIRNTSIYILDEDRRPVGIDEPGEIYIGGDGIARGYLNRPELTKERFVTVEGLRPGGGMRLYRTGDQARWRADGMIDFIGRTDFQVKIRGHRIELEEVEAAILASGLVKSAAITVHEGVHGDKSLVAHVVAHDARRFATAELQAALADTLPPYMVPARIVDYDSLPLNANGKIDRKALVTPRAVRSPVSATRDPLQTQDPLELAISSLWAELLEVPDVAPTDRFFALGGTSLLASRMVLQVREVCRVDFPLHTLYESDQLTDFVMAVRAAQAGTLAGGQEAEGPEHWRADAKLPGDIRAAIIAAKKGPTCTALDADTRVFLTGATGFLGAFLLRDLLNRGHSAVHCLVRAESEPAGLRRIRSSLAKYGLWQESFADRIVPVPGDLTQVRFGLEPDAFAALADNVDAIIHNGAYVSYVQTYSAHRAANIDGTAEAIRLASTGKLRPLHHVSTIAVFGPSGFFGGKRRLREGQDIDQHVEHLRYDIGYSASKWVAEKRVWEAGRLGLPIRVYRPGFIMGDSRTGAGNADDFVGRSVRGMIQLGAVPDLPRQRKEFVTVDYVSQAILTIAGQASTRGQAFHLVPPDQKRSMEVNDFFALISESGYTLETMEYSRWVERLTDECRTLDNPLCPLIPMLCDRVYQDHLTPWELYENMPQYDASNTIAALRGSGVEHTYIDHALVAKYLAYWEQAGHLTAGRASGSVGRELVLAGSLG